MIVNKGIKQSDLEITKERVQKEKMEKASCIEDDTNSKLLEFNLIVNRYKFLLSEELEKHRVKSIENLPDERKEQFQHLEDILLHFKSEKNQIPLMEKSKIFSGACLHIAKQIKDAQPTFLGFELLPNRSLVAQKINWVIGEDKKNSKEFTENNKQLLYEAYERYLHQRKIESEILYPLHSLIPTYAKLEETLEKQAKAKQADAREIMKRGAMIRELDNFDRKNLKVIPAVPKKEPPLKMKDFLGPSFFKDDVVKPKAILKKRIKNNKVISEVPTSVWKKTT